MCCGSFFYFMVHVTAGMPWRDNLMRLSILLLCVTVLVSIAQARAQQAIIEFSADTLETDSQGNARSGKLYVGDGQVRTEFDVNGKTMIQIVDIAQQQAVMINPDQRAFMRRQAGQGELAGGSRSADASPCAGMQNIACKALGKEQIDSRTTGKWEVVKKLRGQSATMYFWVDEERSIPIRQELPDGSSMELHMIEQESVNGRQTEKWEMISIQPDGERIISHHWYDPVIKMNIREQQPEGYSRELVNIKTEAQPAALFAVPQGYNEIQATPGGKQQ
jgi:hypothetical protein